MKELTNKGEKMKKIILMMVVSLAAVSLFAEQHYILRMKGDTSVFTVLDVYITANNSQIIIKDIKSHKDFLVLKKEKNVFYGSFKGYDGIYKLTMQEQKQKKFTGTFTFEPNENGKKRFYLKDKGDCQLIPYEEKTLSQWENDMDKYLYRMDNYKNIEEMAKHSPWARNYLEKRRKITNSKNVPIKFYGKVVDQFDKPVVNADVYLGIRFSPLLMWTKRDKDSHLKTDKEGNFYLSGKGNQVIIDKIECEGYRTTKRFKQDSFSYNTRHINPHVPDPDHPVVFLISKITDQATYLFKNRNFEIKFKSGIIKYISFIDLKDAFRYGKDEGIYKGDYEKDFLPKHYDFKIDALFDEKKSDWTVTFTASGKDGGFIVSDEYLYEAPEKGYQKEFKFKQHVMTDEEHDLACDTDDEELSKKLYDAEKFKLKGKYLYVKSRNPAIYTRIKIEDAVIDTDKFLLSGFSETNPYGERSLEPMEVPYGMGGKLYRPMKKAFSEGKLPEKPDLKKIWEEYKKTHKRVKSSYGGYKWVEKK